MNYELGVWRLSPEACCSPRVPAKISEILPSLTSGLKAPGWLIDASSWVRKRGANMSSTISKAAAAGPPKSRPSSRSHMASKLATTLFAAMTITAFMGSATSTTVPSILPLDPAAEGTIAVPRSALPWQPAGAPVTSEALHESLGDNGSGLGSQEGGGLVAAANQEVLSLVIDQPDAAFYSPGSTAEESSLSSVSGLLPFHAGLARATASPEICSAGLGISMQAGLDGKSSGLPQPANQAEVPAVTASCKPSSRLVPPRRRLRFGDGVVQHTPPSSSSAAKPDRLQQPTGLTGLYTGWLAQTNLGDEIVADIFLDLLTAAIIEATDTSTTVTVDRASEDLAEDGWCGCSMTDDVGCDFGVLGGGSTISADYIRNVANISVAGRALMLFGSGHQSGQKPHRLEEQLIKLLCQQAATHLFGGVRGYSTKGYLTKYGCSDASFPVIRDSALLAGMLYDGGRTTLRAQLKEYSGQRHVVVATPMSSSNLPIFNSTIQALLKTGKFVIVLQPVDEIGHSLFQHFSKVLGKSMPPGAPAVLVHEEYKDWGAVMDLYRHASGSMNSRLHSGVLSLAAMRPTLYLASNKKFDDLMGSIKMRTLLIDPTSAMYANTDSVALGEQIAGRLVGAIRATEATKSQLQRVQQKMWIQYKKVLADLLAKMQQQDPAKYRATMCCQNIIITRSTAESHKLLFLIQCAD